MELWNNGTLTVDRDMDMELIEEIEAIFGEDYKIYVDEREITFDDSEGYILDYLNELAELLEKHEIHITEGDHVFSYGDHDCYYVWNDGAFETMDPEDYAVYSLTDEELRNMMTSRGYCVCKLPTSSEKAG